MQTPQFARYEFLDDAAFNAASSAVSGDFAVMSLAGLQSGLIRPDAATISSSGLLINVTLPAPFGVLFGNGVVAGAHGVLTGLDTQSYTVNVLSLRPASGTVTVYVLASGVAIQQDPYPVIGPPPGHPNYTPGFVPFTAYSQIVDSLALFGSLTPADNATTFEVCRTTLSSGSINVGAISIIEQILAAPNAITNNVSITSNKVLGLADVGVLQEVNASSVHITLPLAANFVAQKFLVSAITAPFTFQSQGGDLMLGMGVTPSSGVSAVTVAQGTSFTMVSDGTQWVALAGAGYAPINSPTLTGVPKAPTAAANNNSTQLSTTAYADTSSANALAAAEAFTIAGFLPLSGGVLTGNLSISTGASPLQLALIASSGQNRIISFQTGANARWNVFATSAAESGGNAGTNFAISRFADNGSFIDNPIIITRSTGVATLSQTPIFPTVSPAANNTQGATTAYTDNGDATTLATAEAFANATFLPLAGGTLFAAGAVTLALDSVGVFNRQLLFQTSASNRWNLETTSAAESGGNAGSNLALQYFNDAGSLLGNAFIITRSTGVMALSQIPTHPTATAGDSSTNSATTAFVSGAINTISGQLNLYSKTQALSTTTANNTSYTLTTQAFSLPSASFTGGFRLKMHGVLNGVATSGMSQNFILSVTDGTTTISGANWLLTAAASGEAVGVESSFYFPTVYAPGASGTITFKVATLGAGGAGGQMAMSQALIYIQEENA